MPSLADLQDSFQQADAAGDTEAAQGLADAIRKMGTSTRGAAAPAAPAAPKSYGDAQGLLNSFAKAASFGLNDELYGAISGLTGGNYQSAVEDMRGRQNQYEDDNPVKSLVAGLTGGLATGIGGGVKAAGTALGKRAVAAYQGTNAMGRLLANIGTGAATGALAGAGNAEKGERLAGAGGGAIVGGATGGLVQPIAYGAQKVADVVMPPVRWTADRLRMGPERQFTRKLAQALERGGLSPERAAARLRQLGPNSMIADVDGARDLAEAFALQPGKSKQAATLGVMQRAKAQADRVSKSLLDSIDVDDIGFHQQIKGIHANMREIGKGYAPLMDTAEIPITQKLERLLEGPDTKAALANAYRIAKQDYANGETDFVVQKFFKIDKEGSVTLNSSRELSDKMDSLLDAGDDGNSTAYQKLLSASQELTQHQKATGDASLKATLEEPAIVSEGTRPTLRVWDYVKRGFDEDIAAGTDPTTGKLTPAARRELVSKKILLDAIDETGESGAQYSALRKAYSDEGSLQSALNLGRGYANQHADVTLDHLSDMSAPEQAMFRTGAARAARDAIMSAPDTGDAYKRVFGNKLKRERLRAVFPDEKSFMKFVRTVEREATFSQTKAALTGNSRTAAREALKDDLGIDPSIIMDIAQGRVGTVAAKLGGRGIQSALQVPEATRDIASQFLYSTNPKQKALAFKMLQAEALRRPSKALAAGPASSKIPLISGLLGMQSQGP